MRALREQNPAATNESSRDGLKIKALALVAVAALVGLTVAASIWVGFRAAGGGISDVVKSVGESASNVVDHVSDGISKLTRAEVTNAFEMFVQRTRKEQQLHVATWSGILSYNKKEKYWPAAYAEVEVRAPVSVPIYVNLRKGAWDFVPRGSTLYVFPPALANGEPAVDNSHIQKIVRYSCWRISESRMLDKAQQGLWSELKNRTGEGSHEARNDAREGVKEFIQNWFSEASRSAKDTDVIVVFPEEIATAPAEIRTQHLAPR